MNKFILATSKSFRFKTFGLAIIFVLSFTTNGTAQRIRYVSTISSGKQDGSSWSNASSNLHKMISLSKAGDQIWLAGNLDKPTCFTKVITSDKHYGVKSYIMTMCSDKIEKPATYIFMDPHTPLRIPRYTIQILKSENKQNPPMYMVLQIV